MHKLSVPSSTTDCPKSQMLQISVIRRQNPSKRREQGRQRKVKNQREFAAIHLTVPQVRKRNGCCGIDSNKPQNIVKCTVLHKNFYSPLNTLNDPSLQCFRGDSSALYELEAIDLMDILAE
ncbi:hypothetical protein Tsp_00971 [Trichinella spiralis]|uniref:hypothetical protein n=1 Tax=Trichinella spiralis TaxID=6334 RepID=UPI0001EFBA87|nr:hypothetical protein Tsp_00971 [Trichinella spiralis]